MTETLEHIFHGYNLYLNCRVVSWIYTFAKTH